jgi:hypothetical protein
MTKRQCPWCGGSNLRRTESNTLQDTRPGDHPYYINVVYWEDRDCGYREVTTPDEWYDYKLSSFVTGEREILRVHKPNPPLPAHQQPEYLRSGKISSTPVEPGQMTFEEAPAP